MAREGIPSGKILFIALAISVLSISSAATLIRLADAPALFVAASRMVIASAILWLFASWTRCYDIKSMNWPVTIGAGFFLALHFGFWITSLESTSVASSLVLVTMNPIVVAIGSTFILKDPPSRPLIIGTVISLIGCAVLVVGEGFAFSGSLKGNFLALGGAVAMSCYMMIGRTAASDGNLLRYVTWVYTIAGVLLTAAVLVTTGPDISFPLRSWVFLFLIALVPQIVGHSLINWSLKYLHTSYLAAAILVEPLAGTLIAYYALGEGFTLYSLSGGILILSGVGLAFRFSEIPLNS